MKNALIGIACGLVTGAMIAGPALAGCGHDVHGAPTIEVTELGDGSSVFHYFSPATMIMDDPSDPRHRAFGECRWQGITTIDGVTNAAGGCFWKDADGDIWIAHGTAKPGDMGTEDRETLHGTAVTGGTGKFASKAGTIKWSGLANGGSYFCDD
jgi:hypothetical protein